MVRPAAVQEMLQAQAQAERPRVVRAQVVQVRAGREQADQGLAARV
ncbi:hypothetical protein GCM10010530_31350 [Kribbella aluminosa]